MRIAYVTETYPPELNGVSLTVERTVRFLRARGHNVELIRPRQPGEARARRRATSCAPPAAPIPMYRELRFGLARVGPLRAPLRSARGPSSSTSRRRGRWPGRRSPRRARSASRRPPTSAPTSTSTAATTASACSPTPVLGLLRRFHNLTRAHLRADAGGARASSAPPGFHNLTIVGRGVDTERFSPARAQRRAAPRSGRPATRAGAARWSAASPPRRTSSSACARSSRRGASRPDLRMVVVGDGPARARLAVGASRRRASSACSAAPSWRRTTRRPTCSCSRACPTPSATSSWRRSLPACRWSSFDVAAAAEHVADGVSGRLVAARRRGRPSSPPSARSTAPAPRARSRCAPRPSPRRAAPPGPKCSRASRPASRTPSMRSKRRRPAFPSWPEQQALASARSGSSASARSRSGCTARRRAPGSCASLDRGQPRRRRLALVRDHRLPAVGRRRRSARSASVRMIGVGIVDLVVYKIIKRWIARPRPYRTCPGIRACARSLDEFSFPSGHTLHSVAFSLILTVVLPGVRALRLAVHAAGRGVAHRPRPALSERRHRRRADRRGHRGGQLQPALARSSALGAMRRRATTVPASAGRARRMNSATVAGRRVAQRALEDAAATSGARRRSRRRADAARGAARGLLALAERDDRVPGERAAAPPGARRAVDDALARRSRVAARQVDELAQRRGVLERPLDAAPRARPGRAARPARRSRASGQPFFANQSMPASMRASASRARQGPELAFAARVAAAPQAVEPAVAARRRRGACSRAARARRRAACARRARPRTPRVGASS